MWDAYKVALYFPFSPHSLSLHAAQGYQKEVVEG